MNKNLYLTAVALLCAFVLQGQDPRFSQFYAAPLQVNPAFSGVFDGRTRAVVNYRVLYPTLFSDQPFRTYAASGEWRTRVTKQDYASFNLTLQQDAAGIARYERGQALLGGSFIKKLAGGRNTPDQFLVAGAQAGIAQHTLGFDRLWFSSQYNRADNSIDRDLPSMEALSGERSNIMTDIQAGLLWYAIFDENASLFVGGALHHITEPRITFLDEPGSRLYRRWTGHAGGEVPITKALSLLPGAIVMNQGPATSATGGLNVRYTNHYRRELGLRSGLWAHFSNQFSPENERFGLDALIFTAILEIERWNLGFSYDVTSSSLRRSNYSRGAFEISLIYFHPAKERYKIECPTY